MPRSSAISEPTTTAAPGRCSCPRCTAHDAGARGPFTPDDFLRIFGVANEALVAEEPPELADLAAELNLARADHEAAQAELRSARRSAAAAARRADSQAAGGPVARQVVEAAATEADASAERLGAAMVAYNDAARDLSDRRLEESRRAELEAQLQARRAEQARLAEATGRRRLRVIKDRVTGARS